MIEPTTEPTTDSATMTAAAPAMPDTTAPAPETTPAMPARDRLNALLERAKQNGQKPAESIQCDGTECFVKRLSYPETSWIQLTALRGQRLLDLTGDEADLRTFSVAALYMAIRTDGSAQHRTFESLSDAAALVDCDESEAFSLVEALVNKTLDINPELLPMGFIRADLPEAPPMPASDATASETGTPKTKPRSRTKPAEKAAEAE
jgi:hypothetical protein